ncbi:TolB-like protein [Labrenzia sp. EL_159]|nr:TolB-like protein [Labrenzia sp. EL_162]MBG6192685.1 TolB-like protein [Labrenzia sp. EL_159]
MRAKLLEISLFGSCIVRSLEPGAFEITGKKHRAIFALLATAPHGCRSRTFLQETLWGASCYDTGRQSLRRALSDIKSAMGPYYNQLITTNNSEVTLDLNNVVFAGQPGQGTFLEGLDVPAPLFEAWRDSVRANPEQIHALFRAPASALPRPPVPTVTVMPLLSVENSPELTILGDWFAEEICRSLSRTNLLAVISHFSSRSLAGRRIDIEAIRSKLNVDYCVAGSIRQINDEVVTDVDFLDAETGRILWTRQFSGKVQDFISDAGHGLTNIVTSVGNAIASDTLSYVRGRPINEIADHKLLMASVSLMHRSTLRDFAKSREMLDEALRRSPRSAEVHAWRGKWHVLSVINGWSSDPSKDTKSAVGSTTKALDIDPENAFCLTIDGFAHNNLLRRLDTASHRYENALEQNPNEALSWLLRGALLAFQDAGEQAVHAARKAQKLSPIDPFKYFYDSLSATAFLAAEDYEEALRLADMSLTRNRRHLSTLRAKITALHFLDRGDEAKEVAEELRSRQPGFTVEAYLRAHPASDYQLGHNVAKALRATGF